MKREFPLNAKFDALAKKYEKLARANGAGDSTTWALLVKLQTDAFYEDRHDQVEAILVVTRRLFHAAYELTGQKRVRIQAKLEREALLDSALLNVLTERRRDGDRIAEELWQRSLDNFGEHDPIATRELIADERDKAVASGNGILAEMLTALYGSSLSGNLLARPLTAAPQVAGHVRGRNKISLRTRKPHAKHGGKVKAGDLYAKFREFEIAHSGLSFAKCKEAFAAKIGLTVTQVKGRVYRAEKLLGIVRPTRHAK